MTDHAAISAYLRRLNRLAATLPRSARMELLADVRAHLQETGLTADSPDDDVALVLRALGSPEQIVAEAMRGHGAALATTPTGTWASIDRVLGMGLMPPMSGSVAALVLAFALLLVVPLVAFAS